MAKADYMMSILWILQARRSVTAQELATELEISTRSVYRYIDGLCASGVPIISDAGHHGGYRLHEGFTSAPLLLDVLGQRTLIQAVNFALDTGFPHSEQLRKIIHSYKQYIGPDQVELAKRHEKTLQVLAPSSSAWEVYLKCLEQGAAEGFSVQMRYRKHSDTEDVQRTIDPYGLVQWKSTWYVVGYCHLRQDIRSFRVDRMADVRLTECSFEIPENFAAADYSFSI
ncbi:putative DNA-binding transcriptional regulator YafY [Paenibacillus shirakamiensis]|uniref:DNA-binding transcriptional regulator YafY n=1 Tax=Paenibacillus shirakamiensis TaxID=1265935 RepID=A0ABS4JBL5_9BACL|nr:WYL domain-containing protein [Paenibacillus shirakamiensis]MBP1999104.1 putative DNA-binding transcriptional regulator YafY [Paenibacillus shirakamiensis]